MPIAQLLVILTAHALDVGKEPEEGGLLGVVDYSRHQFFGSNIHQ